MTVSVAASPAPAGAVDGVVRRGSRGVGEWPFYLVCVWAPVWWAMGVLSIGFLILAPFMVWSMMKSRRRIRMPRTALWWGVLLVVAVVGFVALGQTAPGTLPVSRGQQILPWLTNLATYLSAAVAMVWICSHDEEELPKRRLLHHFGILGLWTVVGGYLGLLMPHLTFQSPTQIILRATIGDGPWMSLLSTPQAAQVQDVFDEGSSVRPAAPYPYTNFWGQMLSFLLVMGLTVWLTSPSRRTRVLAIAVIPIAAVPAILSLNRGLWIGTICVVVWTLIGLIRTGRLGLVLSIVSAAAVAAVLLLASPAGQLIQARSENGHSDSIRSALASDAVTGALASPVIGWGAPRQIQGSPQSIAIGSTDDCDQCGNRRIGSTGLLWYFMFAHGLVGAAAYIALLVSTLWRYRRDVTAIGIGASGVLVLALVYMLTYVNSTIGLVTVFCAIGILYRNEHDQVELVRVRS